MTGFVELIAASLVAGWLFERIAVLILPARAPRHWAPVAGYGAMAIAGVIGGFGFGVWVSVVAPVGAMLPVLCVAWSLTRLDLIALRDVPALDLVCLALLGAGVLAGAGGVGPVNPYAWFYSGPGPVVLVVGLAVWAIWRGQIPVLIALTLGQVFWLADIGSSNLYDQLSHFVLPPALALLACGRGLTAVLAKNRQP